MMHVKYYFIEKLTFCRDKTQNTRGAYWAHFPAQLVDQYEHYDLIRSKMALEHDWPEEDGTWFFLNAKGAIYDRVDCKQLSQDIKTDVTSYSFR